MESKSAYRPFVILICVSILAACISLSSCAFGDNADVLPSLRVDGAYVNLDPAPNGIVYQTEARAIAVGPKLW